MFSPRLEVLKNDLETRDLSSQVRLFHLTRGFDLTIIISRSSSPPSSLSACARRPTPSYSESLAVDTDPSRSWKRSADAASFFSTPVRHICSPPASSPPLTRCSQSPVRRFGYARSSKSSTRQQNTISRLFLSFPTVSPRNSASALNQADGVSHAVLLCQSSRTMTTFIS